MPTVCSGMLLPASINYASKRIPSLTSLTSLTSITPLTPVNIKISLLCLLLLLFVSNAADAQRRHNRRRPVAHRSVRKPVNKHSKARIARPRIANELPVGYYGHHPTEQCEDTCEHVHGIDLSHYQGEVFWQTIGDNTKMAFCYLKATEGGDRIDARYERNIGLAHQHGIKVGSYHFFRPKTPLALQLKNFTAQCLPGEQDLIPMLDVETTGGLSIEQFRDSLRTFLTMLEEAYHQKPLIYTGRNFYNKHLQGQLDDYQLMIAMYTTEEPVLADERDITLWQYTGKGTISGISGFVDKSRFMGTHGLREIRYQH